MTSARVSFAEHEAVVNYDPSQSSVADLIAAVGKAEGPMPSNQFAAKTKKPDE